MKVSAVIDVGFGDSGKGLVVDNICSSTTRLPLVIRFSGGHNAGHTVLADGRKHTFSSFGAGTLTGSPTFFTEDTVIYPPALMREYELLYDLKPVLTIHPHAMLATPADVAFNRMKELHIEKHGSCGAGLGATMKRCIETPYKTFAADLLHRGLMREKFNKVRHNIEEKIKDYPKANKDYFYSVLDEQTRFLDSSLNNLLDVIKISADPNIDGRDVVFEGSQGIMLDMDHGVFPNVTYASTTSKNVFKQCKKLGLTLTDLIYVSRCYLTRHGEGWMPNQFKPNLVDTSDEINVNNQWQGDLRYGKIDYDLITYALNVDSGYHSNDRSFTKSFVITCLDQLPCDAHYKDFLQAFVNMIRSNGINRIGFNLGAERGNLHFR
jgi:adenylosuccinate synthase